MILFTNLHCIIYYMSKITNNLKLIELVIEFTLATKSKVPTPTKQIIKATETGPGLDDVMNIGN